MNNTNLSVSRTRNFACVVYEESSPSDWIDILQSFFVPAFISPYHDSDINPNGEIKKAHWHVLIMFDNVKTKEQAEEIFKAIGGVGCEKVNSLRGYARYLCHLDNPDKHQYDIDSVISLCGADYFECISLISDKYKVLDEMIYFCEKYDISSFYLLSRYAFLHNDSWRRVLADSGSVFMREYLKSKRWSLDSHQTNIIDKQTGELIL